MRGDCDSDADLHQLQHQKREQLGAMRVVQRIHLLATLGAGSEAFDGCVGLCVGPPPRPDSHCASLLFADCQNRCVRLLRPSPPQTMPSAPLNHSTDCAESERCWTQSVVYETPATDHAVLAIASQPLPPPSPSPPHEPSTDELLVVEWLRGAQRPAGWLVRAVWNAGALKYEERARASLTALPKKSESQLMTVALVAGGRVALVGLAFSNTLDVFGLEAPAEVASPTLVSAPPLQLAFRQFCFAIGPPVPEGPQLLALLCRDDHSLHVMLVRQHAFFRVYLSNCTFVFLFFHKLLL